MSCGHRWGGLDGSLSNSNAYIAVVSSGQFSILFNAGEPKSVQDARVPAREGRGGYCFGRAGVPARDMRGTVLGKQRYRPGNVRY